MTLQSLVVAALVIGAFAYTAWVLMPAAWRRGLRHRLGLPLPTERGCGACGDCGPKPPAGATAVITLHQRPPAPAVTPPRDESAGATRP
jgi:hypothetical protein